MPGIILESVKVATFRIITSLGGSCPYSVQYLSMAYSMHLHSVYSSANLYRLKDRSEEMFKYNITFSEQGVNTTWRNRSDTVRLAANMRRSGIINLAYTLHIQDLS